MQGCRNCRAYCDLPSAHYAADLIDKLVPPAEGRWRLKDKHFFNQRGAHLTALDYHKATNMLVVAYSSGVFDLYQVMRAQHLP